MKQNLGKRYAFFPYPKDMYSKKFYIADFI